MKTKSVLVAALLLFSIIAAIGNIEANEENKHITINFEEPVFKEEDILGDTYLEINVDGANSNNLKSGEPMIPIYKETLVLPFGVKITNVNCDNYETKTKEISNYIRPAPQKYVPGYEEIEPEPFIDEAIYSSAEIFPDNWFSYNVGVGIDENMQHKTFLTINVYPVRYKPALNTIEYIDSISVSIEYDDPGLNPFPSTSEYDLVIIAPEKFEADLEPLATHKIEKGLNTMIKTTESIYPEYSGVDKPEQIKKFIQNALEELGVKYILIVGGLNNLIYADPMDTENYGEKWWHVPVRWSNLDYGEPGPVSDIYYADVYREGGIFEDWNYDGDELIGEWKRFGGDRLDLYPDVALGRLACRNNDEVRSVVDKIINYENNAYGSDWFEKIISIAGDGFLDQNDINFEWNTNGLPNGDYTIYAQSKNDEDEYGPIETIEISIDKTQQTQLNFNHDDHTRVPNYPQYPAPPIAEISSVSNGDIIGNSDYSYEPDDTEAYCNRFTGWANVEYKNEILHIRGKTYDPKPYGNLTDIHVWIENSNDETIFDEWKYGFESYSEGDWTVGEKPLLGRAGASYYMPNNFDKEFLLSSNGNWYEEQDVKDAISEGSGFVFFSGHGSPAVWSNHYPGIPGNRREAHVGGLSVVEIENGIPKYKMDEISNDYELPVIVVGGCHNAMFTVSLIPTFLHKWIPDNNMFTYGLPTPECWAWWPVQQSKSGAIATMGNTGYGYGVLGEYCTTGGVDNWITTEFFVQYANGKEMLGEAHAQALSSYIDNIGIADEGDAKTVLQWVLLGDPSLKMGGYPQQATVEIKVKGTQGFNPGNPIELEATSQSASTYDWSIDKDGDGEFDTFVTGSKVEEEWNSPGVYWVKAETNSGKSGLTVVEIENTIPNKPKISGPTNVESGKSVSYTLSGTDPDQDDLYYLVEWGDGRYTVVTPEDSTTVSHKYSKTGLNKITVKAIDSEGLWNEETLSVTVPKTKDKTNNPFLIDIINNLIERFPNIFSMLKQIVELIK